MNNQNPLMKNIVILALVLCFGVSITAFAGKVRGYVRRNGTFVAPHHRSNPNHTKLDNWSSKGNVNPYTGKKGNKSANK